MPVSREDVVAYLLDLRLGAVPDFLGVLTAELGTSASAYGVAATDPGPLLPLTVSVAGCNAGRRRDLIRALRTALGLPMRDAAAVADAAQAVPVATLPAEDAAALRDVLAAAGGRVSLA